MSLRVVLYAEGPGEDRGEDVWLPEPGELLPPDSLGAAHHLVARVIASVHTIPTAAIRFVSPLRLQGRPHRGSDLLLTRNLRRLLTFASPPRRPDLAVVMVDEDEQPSRRKDLVASTQDLPLRSVVAVPVREFEAWLIGDHASVRSLLGVTGSPPAPETMARREAKRLLTNWMEAAIATDSSQRAEPRTVQQLRAQLAQQCDLTTLERLAALQQFREDLRHHLREHSSP